MGNASSTQKLQHAQQNAAMSSSFGDADSDPIQEFKNTFQQYSANYQMPPITQCSIYQYTVGKKLILLINQLLLAAHLINI